MEKLNKTTWLDLSLTELSKHGYGALKAQRLAKRLGVTRGSFYYHFKSIDDFNEALIQHWTNSTTAPLIAEIQSRVDPMLKLERLLQQTLRSGEHLERAIRSWATVDERVAVLVESVDAQRIQFAQELLAEIGVLAEDRNARAKFLYWAAIGRLMMPRPKTQQISDGEIAKLTKLITN